MQGKIAEGAPTDTQLTEPTDVVDLTKLENVICPKNIYKAQALKDDPRLQKLVTGINKSTDNLKKLSAAQPETETREFYAQIFTDLFKKIDENKHAEVYLEVSKDLKTLNN